MWGSLIAVVSAEIDFLRKYLKADDFETELEELSKTRVLLTLLNGNPVWGATNFEKVLPTGESVEYGDGHFCEFTLPGVWRSTLPKRESQTSTDE